MLAYQWIFPGKKLLFMGGELGQTSEWDEGGEVAWSLLEQGPFHAGVQRLVSDLNALYRREPALHRGDYSPEGFAWIDCADHANSVLTFLRMDPETRRQLVVVMNLTPNPRHGYRVGLPAPGHWREMLNTNAAVYGGSDMGNPLGVESEPVPVQGQPHSGLFTLPPLSVSVFGRA